MSLTSGPTSASASNSTSAAGTGPGAAMEIDNAPSSSSSAAAAAAGARKSSPRNGSPANTAAASASAPAPMQKTSSQSRHSSLAIEGSGPNIRNAATGAVAGSQSGDGDGDDGEGDDDDEEYEIKQILGHDIGVYKENQMAYFVSWVGYPESENCWVRESDAENAAEMLAAYWRKKAPSKKVRGVSKTADRIWREQERKAEALGNKRPREGGTGASTSTLSAKRARQLDVKGTSKSKSTYEDSSDEEVDIGALSKEEKDALLKKRARKRYEMKADWEDVVKSVDSIEQGPDKRLTAYVTFANGDRFGFDTAVVNHRCPQKIIALYESRLRFNVRAPEMAAKPESTAVKNDSQAVTSAPAPAPVSTSASAINPSTASATNGSSKETRSVAALPVTAAAESVAGGEGADATASTQPEADPATTTNGATSDTWTSTTSAPMQHSTMTSTLAGAFTPTVAPSTSSSTSTTR